MKKTLCVIAYHQNEVDSVVDFAGFSNYFDDFRAFDEVISKIVSINDVESRGIDEIVNEVKLNHPAVIVVVNLYSVSLEGVQQHPELVTKDIWNDFLSKIKNKSYQQRKVRFNYHQRLENPLCDREEMYDGESSTLYVMGHAFNSEYSNNIYEFLSEAHTPRQPSSEGFRATPSIRVSIDTDLKLFDKVEEIQKAILENPYSFALNVLDLELMVEHLGDEIEEYEQQAMSDLMDDYYNEY